MTLCIHYKFQRPHAALSAHQLMRGEESPVDAMQAVGFPQGCPRHHQALSMVYLRTCLTDDVLCSGRWWMSSFHTGH